MSSYCYCGGGGQYETPQNTSDGRQQRTILRREAQAERAPTRGGRAYVYNGRNGPLHQLRAEIFSLAPTGRNMSRRDHGPKRRAERYAYRVITKPDFVAPLNRKLVAAYMAGYRSASRARRKPDPDITRALEMLNDALSGAGRPGDK